jgi:hypothetical protein
MVIDYRVVLVHVLNCSWRNTVGICFWAARRSICSGSLQWRQTNWRICTAYCVVVRIQLRAGDPAGCRDAHRDHRVQNGSAAHDSVEVDHMSLSFFHSFSTFLISSLVLAFSVSITAPSFPSSFVTSFLIFLHYLSLPFLFLFPFLRFFSIFITFLSFFISSFLPPSRYFLSRFFPLLPLSIFPPPCFYFSFIPPSLAFSFFRVFENNICT